MFMSSQKRHLRSGWRHNYLTLNNLKSVAFLSVQSLNLKASCSVEHLVPDHQSSLRTLPRQTNSLSLQSRHDIFVFPLWRFVHVTAPVCVCVCVVSHALRAQSRWPCSKRHATFCHATSDRPVTRKGISDWPIIVWTSVEPSVDLLQLEQEPFHTAWQSERSWGNKSYGTDFSITQWGERNFDPEGETQPKALIAERYRPSA